MITKTPVDNFATPYDWIDINPTYQEQLENALQGYELDDEILQYSQDKYERARIEYVEKIDTFVLIFNLAKLKKESDHYDTVPMTFLVQANRLITISDEHSHYIIEAMKDYLTSRPAVSIYKLLFKGLSIISEKFLPLIEQVEQERDQIASKLRQKATKEDLLSLSDLNTSVLYFKSAAKQNTLVLEQIRTHFVYKILDDVEREEYEDSIIEAKQLLEMIQLLAEVQEQLSGTFNNILNNNLNETMRILTVLSILMTLPTIITGFYGMNVALPFADQSYSWMLVILFSAASWGILSYILARLMRK